MRHATPIPAGPAAHGFRPRPAEGAIEWEELPSLADSLASRLVTLGLRREGRVPAGRAWDATLPASLETLPPTRPFREALAGCAVREVDDQDVFRHFFGD
jgi:hypothetical protein